MDLETWSSHLKVFADATKSVYTKWKPQIGTNLVDMAEKAIAGSRK